MTESFAKDQKMITDQIDSLTSVMDSIARFSDLSRYANKGTIPIPDTLNKTLEVSQEKLQELIKAIQVPSPSDGSI